MLRIPAAVEEILERLEAAGFEAWCVGGAVRDALLGREAGDWDVASSAPPERVLALFAPRALPTGLQHGTVTVKTGTGSTWTAAARSMWISPAPSGRTCPAGTSR